MRFDFTICRCYTSQAMAQIPLSRRLLDGCLCLWVLAAQLWYLFQFRPLVELFARKVLHR